jgi:LPS sulfotransferase NodH
LRTSSSSDIQRRFLIVGLPRSGTTYLMTLLNSHRGIYCSGEQFNPNAIVGIGSSQRRYSEVLARDRTPLIFMQQFFERAKARDVARVGFKYMIGHNIRILQKLAEYPDIELIYVWRENRLAQISSLIKAAQSKRWAQTRPDAHIHKKITVDPRRISQRWHEFATFDHLFSCWLDTLPHRRITLEYRALFAPGFAQRISDFLELPADPKMKSPLVKQNPNAILERFENPGVIQHHFRQIGYEHWLEPEL